MLAAYSYTSPDGKSGIQATLEHMRLLVMNAVKDPGLISLVNGLTKNLEPRDYTGEITAIYNWVRDYIRYRRDIEGVETLIKPDALVFNPEIARQGDCDDFSMLLATMLKIAGYPTRFIAGVVPGARQGHVYVQVNTGNKWVTLDAIHRSWQPGQEAQGMVPVASRSLDGYLTKQEKAAMMGSTNTPAIKVLSIYVNLKNVGGDKALADQLAKADANQMYQIIRSDWQRLLGNNAIAGIVAVPGIGAVIVVPAMNGSGYLYRGGMVMPTGAPQSVIDTIECTLLSSATPMEVKRQAPRISQLALDDASAAVKKIILPAGVLSMIGDDVTNATNQANNLIAAAASLVSTIANRVKSWFTSKGAQQLKDRENLVKDFMTQHKTGMDQLYATMRDQNANIWGGPINWGDPYNSAAYKNGTDNVKAWIYGMTWLGQQWTQLQVQYARGKAGIQDAFYQWTFLAGGPEWPERHNNPAQYGLWDSLRYTTTKYQALVDEYNAAHPATPATPTTPTTPPVTPNPQVTIILKQGSTGAQVLLLQSMLLKMGFDPKGQDGIYGPNTVAAVKAFQAKYNLPQTGEVGNDMLTYLASLVAPSGGTVTIPGGQITISPTGQVTVTPTGGTPVVPGTVTAGGGGGGGGGQESFSTPSSMGKILLYGAGAALVIGGIVFATKAMGRKTQINPARRRRSRRARRGRSGRRSRSHSQRSR